MKRISLIIQSIFIIFFFNSYVFAGVSTPAKIVAAAVLMLKPNFAAEAWIPAVIFEELSNVEVALLIFDAVWALFFAEWLIEFGILLSVVVGVGVETPAKT